MNIAYWLAQLAYQFGSWAQSLYGTANSISGVPILGPYLSGAFRFAGDRMVQAFSATVQMQFEAIRLVVAIQEAQNFLSNLNPIRWWAQQLANFISNPLGTLPGWLGSLIPLFNYLRYDQAGWMRAFIGGLAWHVPQWLSDPAGWVRDRLFGLYGELRSIATDPLGWLRGKFPLISTYLNQIVNDPLGFVRDRLTFLVPGWSTFASDPGGWIANYLSSKYGLAVAFFADPASWVWSKLTFRFPDLGSLVAAPGAFVVEKTLAGLENALDTYKARLVKIADRALSSLF